MLVEFIDCKEKLTLRTIYGRKKWCEDMERLKVLVSGVERNNQILQKH
jgi:hypothetical protein